MYYWTDKETFNVVFKKYSLFFWFSFSSKYILTKGTEQM